MDPRADTDDGADEMAWLARLLDVVRERSGIDFSGYRAATLMRRVRNRMIAAGVRTLPDYFERLRDQPAEAGALIERLTIKVSRFFRDPATFAAMSDALARRASGAGGPLRIWSAGCGQGEEAYSLAILLDELGQPAGGADVLATDIDAAALGFAERGCYAAAAVDGMSAERRARHFDERLEATTSRLCVKPALRRRVELRVHDVTGPAGPAEGRRFDLICCRNLLIYLQPSLQLRVEELLRDHLLPGGLLCLGEAEWLLPVIAPSFDAVDRKARLFALRPPAAGAIPA